MRRFFGWKEACFCLFVLACLPAAAPADVIQRTSGVIPGSILELCVEKGPHLRIEEVAAACKGRLFQKADEIPVFGFMDEALWVHFQFESTESDPDWILDLHGPLLESVDLFVYRAGGWEKHTTGAARPVSMREQVSRGFAFPLTLEPGRPHEFWIRLQTEDVMEIPLSIIRPREFFYQTLGEFLGFGLYGGVMLVMSLYNFFIFFSTRDRAYLYYVLYALSAGLFVLSQNGVTQLFLFPNAPFLHRAINLGGVSLTALSAIFFTRAFLNTRLFAPWIDRLLWIEAWIAIVILLPSVFFAGTIQGFANVGTALLALLTFFSAGIAVWRRGYLPARFYTSAWFFFIAGSVLYALKSVAVLPSVFLTQYGLPIGSVVEVSLLSLALADRINRLKAELSGQVELLHQANITVERSEKKYRKLVEGTQDLIFSLNADGKFLTINGAVRSQLGYAPAAVLGRQFLDFVWSGATTEAFSLLYAQEQWDRLMNGKGPVRMDMHVKMSHGEPRAMQVFLELIEDAESPIVLGKAASRAEDQVLTYFKREAQKYVLDNLLVSSELISQRLTRNLGRYMHEDQLPVVRVAVREIIVNAIEHGNLGISYDEKSRAIESGDYLGFVARRQKDPRYRDRKVTVSSAVNPRRFLLRVSDQGDGFDHRKLGSADAEQLMRDGIPHGRGILMARGSFDLVHFNDKGNSVLLVKFFNGRSPGT